MRFRIESPEVTRRTRPTIIPGTSGVSGARRGGREKRTGKDGDDGLVDSRDLFHLEHVAGEEGGDEKHDRDEEGPGGEELLLRRVALWIGRVSAQMSRC